MQQFYKLGKTIGYGTYGKVKIGLAKETRRKVAIKSLKLTQSTQAQLFQMNEVRILQQLTHDNVIRLIDLFRDDGHLYLVTDLCTGGELFAYVDNHGAISEQSVKIITR